MIGVAYQLGQLPLSLESLEWGIQETMGSAATENWQAFKMGRKIVVDAQVEEVVKKANDHHQIVAEKSEILKRGHRGGKKLSQQYWQLVAQANNEIPLSAKGQCLLAERVYDLIQFEGIDLAKNFVERLQRLSKKDHSQFNSLLRRQPYGICIVL